MKKDRSHRRLSVIAVSATLVAAALFVMSFLPVSQGSGHLLFGFAVVIQALVALAVVSRGLASDSETTDTLQSLRQDLSDARAEAAQTRAEVAAKSAEVDRFTYIVSHDLRSPLLTIQGFSDILRMDVEEGKPEAIEEDLAHIFKATQRMRQLLDDLLELSRIGRFNEDAAPAPLTEVVNDSLYEVRNLIEEKGAEIKVAEDLPTWEVDRARVQQLFRILLDNSVRYHNEGQTPEVEVGRRPGAEGRDEIFVRDHGAGLEPEQLEKAFGPFERFSANSEGTGMGLAHAQRIAAYHQGWIRAESEGKGLGTTIVFSLSKPKGSE